MSEPIAIPLRGLRRVEWSQKRRGEPVTVGIPLPRGLVADASILSIHSGCLTLPGQFKALDRWPDESVRWVLVDTVISAESGWPDDAELRTFGGTTPTDGDLNVTTEPGQVRVSTRAATFEFIEGGRFPLSAALLNAPDGTSRPVLANESGLEVDCEGLRRRCAVTAVEIRERGPLRAEIEVHGRVDGLPWLEVLATAEVFAGAGTLRLGITIRNTRRARHPAGRWPLGDAGSTLVKSASLVLATSEPVLRVHCAPESGSPLSEMQLPFEIRQESSGGEHWNAPVHRNRDGAVPLRFRGYRMTSGDRETTSHRASPVVIVESKVVHLALTIRRFWQAFPHTMAIRPSGVEIGLLPEAADLHELQGGEQKTDTIVLAFGGDPVSDPPLAWVHDPLMVYPAAEWIAGTDSETLLPRVPVQAGDYEAFANLAFDEATGFPAKREAADEYGWRNFGDLPADHESAFQPPAQPFVSHYNNQYDAIAAFGLQFLRTGDRRWWSLMDDLACHVRDIDIYRTRQDKAAYNGGLFWHTSHYADAGTSTHRSYSAGGKESGGPAAEHNYNTGLMLHYFLTGDRASREAAVGLATWVLDLDDGRLTPFRWLAGGPTGLASASGSPDYHGPGRAGGNSIAACLVGHRLTGDSRFLAKAEELIRRSVHPRQQIDRFNLLDAERRWFYTVFLQALGAYLDDQTERGRFDEMFAYARESLLHYARWMAANERPYLDHPEGLEYPTETWAAQELRKTDVFLLAAKHAPGQERVAFLERASFFRDYALGTLAGMPSVRYTRPMVLLLGVGLRPALEARAKFAPMADGWGQGEVPSWSEVEFEPQKARALRRARILTLAGVSALLVTAALMLAGAG